MKLEEIRRLWEEDSKINPKDLSGELFEINRLHSKYTGIYIGERQLHKAQEIEYNRLKKIKRDYYLGRLPRKFVEENDWEPIEHEIRASDVGDYLRGDSDLCKIESKMAMQEIKLDLLKEIVKSIHTRSYNIRTALDYMKWKDGAG